jgi:hypothetical protein
LTGRIDFDPGRARYLFLGLTLLSNVPSLVSSVPKYGQNSKSLSNMIVGVETFIGTPTTILAGNISVCQTYTL